VLRNPTGDLDTLDQDLFLNRETGQILYPDTTVRCEEKANQPGVCDTAFAKKFAFTAAGRDTTIENYPVPRWSVGRYQYVDQNVLNGFLYFYSVTAFDSTGRGALVAEQEGRQAAVEGEGVVPQNSYAASVNNGKPYVVPNP